MKKILFFSILLILTGCKANSRQNDFDSSPPSHQLWTALLSKHVESEGDVNYKGFINDKEKLNKYLESLSNAHPNSSWTKNQRMAYWINAYNAFTVKLIIDHYPVETIKDIGGIVQSPWDIEFINIEGKKYSLGDIEHEILRKKFDDPRIHFAINCASYSCPELHEEAFTGDKLDKQLDLVAKEFINDPKRNKISANSVKISEIFKWFKEDFTNHGDIIDYLNNYSNIRVNKNASVGYLSYNWELNE